jgi:hypothetical protein
MMPSAILQVLTFSTICCSRVTYNFVNKWNQKRIHASVATRDRFEMIKIKIGPVEHTLLLIFAQDRECPKTGQSSRTLINMTTLRHIRYAKIYLRADYMYLKYILHK